MSYAQHIYSGKGKRKCQRSNRKKVRPPMSMCTNRFVFVFKSLEKDRHISAADHVQKYIFGHFDFGFDSHFLFSKKID